MRGARRRLYAGITVALTLAAILALLELLLRFTGHEPWERGTRFDDEPIVHEPDPVLGWRTKEGTFVFPPYTPDAVPIRMTCLPGGIRSTGSNADDGTSVLVTVGGSITQGWAISDEETYPWKLQRKFSSIRVLNYGTAAYGTYQSLLVLERLFSSEDRPKHVLYGFIAGHEFRNIAHVGWLGALAKYSRRGTVRIPYCTIDREGALVRHPPEGYPFWPLRERLAAIAYLQKACLTFRASDRISQAREVTEKLLLEMKHLAERNRAELTVALLQASPAKRRHYAAFTQESGIDFVDCVYPTSPELQVPGEGHPNGRMNTLWADCIGKVLASGLRPSGTPG